VSVVDATITGDAMATDWDAVLAEGAEDWEALIVRAVGHGRDGTQVAGTRKRGTRWTFAL
jgi:hypothetical protein